MEILKNFGFEPVFFTAQIINFLILFFVFKRFLYKPILKILKDRTNAIEKGLRDTESARVALEEAEAQKEKIIAQAHDAALLELASARDQASDISIELSKKVLDRVLTEFFTKEEKERICTRNILSKVVRQSKKIN